MDALGRSGSGPSIKTTGSYTNTHESGKKYHGKGDKERAGKSAEREAKRNNDPVVKSTWKKEKNEREAFKAEDRRLSKDGGPGYGKKRNYNRIKSPGKKYNKQDKNKPKPPTKPKPKPKKPPEQA